VSLKPPWRHENPIMEKACPAYYKNTAPAEHIEIMENVEVIDRAHDIKAEPKVVHNGKYLKGKHKSTTILWIVKNERGAEFSIASLRIQELPNRFTLFFGKHTFWEITVKYKGETLFKRGRGSYKGGIKKIKKG